MLILFTVPNNQGERGNGIDHHIFVFLFLVF